MADNRDRGHMTWVTGAGFGVLTVNSVLAMYRARGDYAAVAFVAGSYLTLLLLFGALRGYERAPPGSPATARARARRAVWVWPLTTLLTGAAFAWKVAGVMPPGSPARRGVWPLATVLTLGVGVVNCDMSLSTYKASGDAGSAATCALVLASYAALLALVWLLVRELAVAGQARRVVVGSGEEDNQGRGGSVGAANGRC